MDPARDGRDLRARIGVLPEQAGFYDWMSGREYLDWSARLYGKRPGQSETTHLLRRVGLDPADPSGIGSYSRGMRQRMALARALINRPALLVLDEPTNGLDPRGRREIHDVLLGLSQKEGIGILLCTHLLDDVDRLCSSVGILAEGQTLLEGSIPDLLGRRRASLCYRILVESGSRSIQFPPGIKVVTRIEDWWHIELAPDLVPAEAWLRLVEAGFWIQEIHREGGGLEELYLAATEPQEEAI
jgi:ABC-2 type transport system ATP-binding protein